MGGLAAWKLYWGNVASDPLASIPPWYTLFDEVYQWLVDRVQGGMANMSEVFDHYIIDGLGVAGISTLVEWSGRLVRCFQTGNVQTYAFLLSLGVWAVLYFVLR
jgi:NADH-quinone oxidoreductase subunit L